jgi:hypothetical protein
MPGLCPVSTEIDRDPPKPGKRRRPRGRLYDADPRDRSLTRPALAMQKVEGSNPFSRFLVNRRLLGAGFVLTALDLSHPSGTSAWKRPDMRG